MQATWSVKWSTTITFLVKKAVGQLKAKLISLYASCILADAKIIHKFSINEEEEDLPKVLKSRMPFYF